MTNEEIQEFKKLIKKTLNVFKDFRDREEWSFQEKSDKIWEELRNLNIYIHKDGLRAANISKHASLSPYDKNLRFLIRGAEDYVDELYPLYANSLGAYKPDEFFNYSKESRILAVFKEPYISKESWVKGDRGGHAQAYYNRVWSKMESATHINFTSFTRTLINKQENSDISEDMAIGHEAALEVNPFPGLEFNSTKTEDSILTEWYSLLADFLEFLVDFHDSKYIFLTRTTLNCLINNENGTQYVLKKQIVKSISTTVNYVTLNNEKRERSVEALKDDKDRWWIVCPHFSVGCWKNQGFCKRLAEWITAALN